MKNVWGVIGLCLLSLSANAAPLLAVPGSGRSLLAGFTGVVVNSVSYDVSFVDGTCAALFTGCDEDSDFFFGSNEAAAVQASIALRDQVFLDVAGYSFDSDYTLTRGCEVSATDGCYIFTPFHMPNLNQVQIALTFNRATEAGDEAGNWTLTDPMRDTSNDPEYVYAIWQQSAVVPIPPAVWLFGSALGVMGWMRRKIST